MTFARFPELTLVLRVADELAAGSIQSDLPGLVHVVGRTLEATISKLAADGWEDAAFLSYFA
jgi:hypothetical protein